MHFKIWAKKGITAYCTIIDKGQLLDFNSLKERFNLDSKDFFRYLQLRQHFYQKIKKGTDGDPNKSALVKIFSSMLKTITKLYRALMDFINLYNEIHLCTLRRDGRKKVVLLSQLRTGKIYVNYNGQPPVLHIGENFAVWFFLAPKQKNIFLGNAKFWRHCGSQDANHFHIFWGCPNVRRFWKDIHNVL